MEEVKRKKRVIKDITGQKFNYLTVVSHAGTDKNRNSIWNCICDCGETNIVNISNLKNGNIKSCGCLKANNGAKHNLSNTREYTSWCNMKTRCTNPNTLRYKDYGGRGITVCDRWLNSFENFISDMGLCPEGYSIERIENDKGYSKDNCKWVDRKEQDSNKRNSIIVTFNNETKPLFVFCEELGINYSTAYVRYTKYNWNIEKTLNKKENE